MIQISGLKLQPGQSEEQLSVQAARLLGVAVTQLTIQRVSIDARHKGDVHLVYTVTCSCKNEAAVLRRCRSKGISSYTQNSYRFPNLHREYRNPPVVIGAGPAGLFCALMLARAGAKPVLIERGRPVEQRIRDVERYSSGGPLLLNSNLQFGEGGAGTFSDGKLNTGVNDPRMDYIRRELVRFGAPQDILYLSMPHVGTDYLRRIIYNIRCELLRLGASVYFENQLVGIESCDGRLTGLRVHSAQGDYILPTEQVCLAIGHSARDTFGMLYEQGIAMQPKRFAVGVRIEHLQSEISRAQFGSAAELLPPASYKLSCHLENGRSAYSFCVCPGGVVMAAASEPQTVVTNGMSEYARNRTNINGALLVGVGPQDYPSDHPLAGIAFQRELEHAAWLAGGKTGFAPAQRVADFLRGTATTVFGTVQPSYRPGAVGADLHTCLPEFITETIAAALPILGRKLTGYDNPDAVLTAVESRSSSPVRIPRDQSGQSSLTGLFPCGEGAGYAGGIMSAAADGMKCAQWMLEM